MAQSATLPVLEHDAQLSCAIGEMDCRNGSDLPREVSVADAAHLIETITDLVILDIRTPFEFDEGHIEASFNLDFFDDGFEEALSKLDREATYLLYCRCGGRSAYALDLMDRLGFTSAAHMPGGVEGWQLAGSPLSTK